MIKPSRSLQITVAGHRVSRSCISRSSASSCTRSTSRRSSPCGPSFRSSGIARSGHDDELINAAWLSLRIAFLTACASVVIGTWAGFVLARMGRFRGFTLYTGMINAPLVIPEVIQGISLLLLFVEMAKLIGWPAGRGLFTIWIGHVMLCISYVAIIVESRVRELNPSLEEAALDLGATPLRVFFSITLPLISQALVAGWLLSFTLSIDDLVLSAFLSGPGSTTLPLVVFSRVRLGSESGDERARDVVHRAGDGGRDRGECVHAAQ